MEVSGTHCGDRFIIYVNQTIMLYALNLQSDVYHLFPNKPGKHRNKQTKYLRDTELNITRPRMDLESYDLSDYSCLQLNGFLNS